ncbi:MAG: type II secretion system GspH family protein [Candidatus Dojkabacteria bacterium]|nr:type II secretion system GspH family protein [Candidatus Dojkabacteria bacterium]
MFSKLKAFTLVDLLVGMAVSSIVLTTVAVFSISIYLKAETNTVREALNQIINILAEQQKYVFDVLAYAKQQNLPNKDRLRVQFFPNQQNTIDDFDTFCNSTDSVHYSMFIDNNIINNSNNSLTIRFSKLNSTTYANYQGPVFAGVRNSRINTKNIKLLIERKRENNNYLVLITNVIYEYDTVRKVTVPSYQLRINRNSVCD